MAAGVELRVRHGVVFDWAFGYRAVREVNGEREFVGPWTTEAQAQANAETAARIMHEAIDDRGLPKVKGDTPLDAWIPS